MQLQDRALHKQLLSLHSGILNFKADLKASWEHEQVEAQYHVQTPAVVTKVEVLDTRPESPNPQIVHVKQDSGFLTDEELSDEERDVFFDPQEPQIRASRGRSISLSNLFTGKPSETPHDFNTDMNNNFRDWRSQSVRVSNKDSSAFKGFNLSQPRERSKTYHEGQFNRVNSMPVIKELPNNGNRSRENLKNLNNWKAFAVYGYKSRQAHHGKRTSQTSGESPAGIRKLPVAFGTLSRHESMPVIGKFNSVRQRSKTAFIGSFEHHTRAASSLGFRSQSHDHGRPVLTRASSQTDVRRAWDESSTQPEYRDMKLYKVYRTASQISLV